MILLTLAWLVRWWGSMLGFWLPLTASQWQSDFWMLVFFGVVGDVLVFGSILLGILTRWDEKS